MIGLTERVIKNKSFITYALSFKPLNSFCKMFDPAIFCLAVLFQFRYTLEPFQTVADDFYSALYTRRILSNANNEAYL